MQAGFAKIDITPPLGTRMFGWGTRDETGGCTGVHDSLFVRALWLTDQDEDVLIMGFDLLFFSRDIADRLRGAIGRAFDLAPRQVLLNTSHTHNGPTTGTWWTALFESPDTIYLDQLERAVLAAADEAMDQAREVCVVRHGSAKAAMALSRRNIGPDGKASWEANTENTIYDTIPICLLEDVHREPVAVLFSVSCHPSTVPGRDISADYPGAAMAMLDERLGVECSLFLQGVGGDTKVRSCREACAFGTTWDDQNSAGRMVADAVMAAIESDLEPTLPALVAEETTVALPLEDTPDRSGYTAIMSAPDTGDMKRLWASRMIERLDRGEIPPSSVPLSMHGVKIGQGVRMIGIEGEVVADHGGLIARMFDRGTTFPMGYCDGCQLYIPSDRMLPEGGYEVDSFAEYHVPAALAGGIDEALVAGCRELHAAGID
jgi:neutral ceramidase